MTLSLENITLAVPAGTSNHGDPHLLCTPSKWTNIAAFFLANFFSHAATVKSLPGEPAMPAFFALLLSLIFPTSGVIRTTNCYTSARHLWQNASRYRCKSRGSLCGSAVPFVETSLRR